MNAAKVLPKCYYQGMAMKSTFCVLMARGILNISAVELSESIQLVSQKNTTISDVVHIVTKCFPNIWQMYYSKYDLWIKLSDEAEFKSLNVKINHSHSIPYNKWIIPTVPIYLSPTLVLLAELDQVEKKQNEEKKK